MNNNLTEHISSDNNFTKEAYQYMKQEFDKERAKPEYERDYDKLERLSSEMCELLDGDKPFDTDSGKARLLEKIQDNEQKMSSKSVRRIRKFIPAILLVAALTTLNCVSVFAFDMNIVSAVISFTKGGFSVGFNKEQEVIELPTSDSDPYGIITECAKYDIYPETPFYLPDGFYLEHISNNVNEEFANTVCFVFKKQNQSIGISFDRYWNDVAKTGIPSDHYNISETTVNGHAAIVSKEDNQYTITYNNGDTVFLMFTKDVPYDECEKIVQSIK